jgi:hypothetical protein
VVFFGKATTEAIHPGVADSAGLKHDGETVPDKSPS